MHRLLVGLVRSIVSLRATANVLLNFGVAPTLSTGDSVTIAVYCSVQKQNTVGIDRLSQKPSGSFQSLANATIWLVVFV